MGYRGGERYSESGCRWTLSSCGWLIRCGCRRGDSFVGIEIDIDMSKMLLGIKLLREMST